MCFDKQYSWSESTRKPKPTKAKEDIKVYKLIDIGGFGMCYNLYIKDKLEKWTPGYWYEETTPFKGVYWNTSTKFLSVNGNAFHSCKTMKVAKDKQEYCRCMKIVKMIIPKGALYYENKKEYVSSQIIYPK